MRRWTFLPVVAVTLGAACSPSGSVSGRCHDLQSKLDSCSLVLNSPIECGPSAIAIDACRVGCMLGAQCRDLAPSSKDNPFLLCEKDCYPWGSTAFICDDLSGFVANSLVCDGVRNCDDGSDEKSCPSRDAGTDARVKDAGKG